MAIFSRTGGDPSRHDFLLVEVDVFDIAVQQLPLQSLSLGALRFDTDLDSFWESIAQLELELEQLRLDYITFETFDHFKGLPDSNPVAMPAVASALVSLR